MATFKSFEDIEVWQKARTFAGVIYSEVRSQLYRAFDRNHIHTEDFENLKSEIEIITRQISGLINYLKNSELKGPKYVREPEENYKLNLEL